MCRRLRTGEKNRECDLDRNVYYEPLRRPALMCLRAECRRLPLTEGQNCRYRNSVTVLGTPASLADAVHRSLARWSALSNPAHWKA